VSANQDGKPMERIVCMHRRSPGPVGLQAAGANLADAPGQWSPGAGLSFLKRPDFRHFQEVVAGLRELCPTAFSVIVRTSEVPEHVDGLTKRRQNRFVICLDRNLSEQAAVGVLIHEWAHCMSWSLKHDRAADEFNSGLLTWADFERATHDASFGVAYSQAWAAYSAEMLPASG